MVSHHTQKPRCRKTWLRPHATVRWSNNLLGFESGGVSIERLFTHEVASTKIYWNKRRRLHKKRMQLPQDCLGTTTWPPFHCFGTPIWPPWRHVKTLYKYRLQGKSINGPTYFNLPCRGYGVLYENNANLLAGVLESFFFYLDMAVFFFKKGK